MRSVGLMLAPFRLMLLLLLLLMPLVVAVIEAAQGEDQFLDGGTSNFDAAKLNEFPFIAHIIIWNDSKKKNDLCTGTILEDRYILTAASCVCSKKSPNSIVRLEYIKIGLGCSNEKKCEHNYRLSRVIVHKDFGPDGLNDMALLRLNASIKFNADKRNGPFVDLVNLESGGICMESEVAGVVKKMRVVGWGDSGAGLRIDRLSSSLLTRASEQRCKQWFPSMDSLSGMCYGTGAKHICRYDLGSPLLDKVDAQHYIQVGLVSGRGICAGQWNHKQSAMPFQKGPMFYPWIASCIATDGVYGCSGVVSTKWW